MRSDAGVGMTYYVPVSGSVLFAFKTKAGRDAYVARQHRVTELTRSLTAFLEAEPAKALPPADYSPEGFRFAEKRSEAS